MSNMPFSSTLRSLGLLALLSVHVGVEASQPNVQSFEDAIMEGKLQELNNLLKNADQDTLKDFLDKHSLLDMACEEDNPDIVKALIDKGADLNIVNDDQNTPLHTALWGEREDIAKLLVNNNAKLNIQGLDGNTPLHLALGIEKDEIAKLLVKKLVANKDDLNIQNDYGETPLHRAINKGKDEIATLLINSNAKLDIQVRYGNTPLHIALEKGKDKIATLLVNKLVASKANLNIQEEYGMTPLHLAVEKKNYAVAALLVQGGANPDIQTRYSRTPREIAVSDQKMEAILNTKKNKGLSNANNQESLLNRGVSVDNILKNSSFKDGKQSSQGSFSKNDYNDLNYLTDKSQISTQGSNQGGLQPSNTGNIKSMFANNSTQRMSPQNVLNQNNVLQGDLNKKNPINNLLNRDPTKSNLPQKALFALLVLVALGAICYFVAPKEENPKQHGRRASQEARYQAAQQPLPYQAVTTQPWAYPMAQPA